MVTQITDIPDDIMELLNRTNSVLSKSRELVDIATDKMVNEDADIEKKGPKLVPVLFNKRAESDILEKHRGNYRRHWETSSR